MIDITGLFEFFSDNCCSDIFRFFLPSALHDFSGGDASVSLSVLIVAFAGYDIDCPVLLVIDDSVCFVDAPAP